MVVECVVVCVEVRVVVERVVVCVEVIVWWYSV